MYATHVALFRETFSRNNLETLPFSAETKNMLLDSLHFSNIGVEYCGECRPGSTILHRQSVIMSDLSELLFTELFIMCYCSLFVFTPANLLGLKSWGPSRVRHFRQRTELCQRGCNVSVRTASTERHFQKRKIR